MKAVRYWGKEEIRYEDIPKPVIGDEEALIQIAFAGVCGSDMSIYSGSHPRAKAPLVLGHEISGQIAGLPPSYKGEFVVGESVTINPLLSCQRCTACLTGNTHVCQKLGLTGIDTDGGFAEFVRVPLSQLVKLPSGMSLEHGAIVEPVAVAVHAIRRSTFQVGDIVLVIGGGPMGVLVALAVNFAGARKVLVIEPNDFRRNLISKLGFETMPDAEHDTIMSATKGDGADVVYEVAGVQAAMDAAVEYCKIRGQVVNVSVFKKPASVDLRRVNFAELDIIGTRVYTNKDYAAAVDLVAKYPEFAKIITHRFRLNEAQMGIDLIKAGGNNLKVLLYP
jgi:2-desacetyl-2-hydroxyethyl bacteriochlorophyllide A dehydrogenase